MEGFAPAQLILGAVIGFLPGLALFYLDGRRVKADRIRQHRIASLDAAIGRMNKLLDHAAAEIVSTPERPISGVLPHDPLAYFTADTDEIPEKGALAEFTILVTEVMQGGHRDEAGPTMRRLSDLFVRFSASAAKRRAELAE